MALPVLLKGNISLQCFYYSSSVILYYISVTHKLSNYCFYLDTQVFLIISIAPKIFYLYQFRPINFLIVAFKTQIFLIISSKLRYS